MAGSARNGSAAGAPCGRLRDGRRSRGGQARSDSGCGATLGQIEQAMAWVSGESAVIGGELPRPLAGPVGVVYEILASELPPLGVRA